MDSIADASIARLPEFSAFDLSILVWAFDVLNLGDSLKELLPGAMDHFHFRLQDGELQEEHGLGMFWFDFASVVHSHVGPKARASFDTQFQRHLLEPVVD